MAATGLHQLLRVTTVVITGAIAISAYAGTIGLLGGGISFGEAVDARLPFASLLLAGIALLMIVALPMTAAAVAAWCETLHAADVVVGAGVLLVAWIAVELAFIQVYSWFHPTYLGAAVVVLVLGWLLSRTASSAPRQTARAGRLSCPRG